MQRPRIVKKNISTQTEDAAKEERFSRLSMCDIDKYVADETKAARAS